MDNPESTAEHVHKRAAPMPLPAEPCDYSSTTTTTTTYYFKETRSADAYYVADVYDFYFNDKLPKDHCCVFFRALKITRIYLSGDHGGHFSASATMYRESLFERLYNIELFTMFLCSYHAYNRSE